MRFPAFVSCCALAVVSAGGAAVRAQDRRPMDVPDVSSANAPARQRLVLKDGTYQIVLGYKVVGKVVRYQSAERNGETEEIPLDLVDLPATKRWFDQHQPGAQDHPVLTPELAREEAERAARSPEISPGLRLPEEDSVLVLDTFNGTPEVVPVPQQGTDLNKETAHAVAKSAINPASSAHRILDLKGQQSDVQIHVPDPVFYVRIGKDDEGDPGGAAFTVDTHGSLDRATPGTGSADSGYVLERLTVRYDLRELDSFRLGLLDSGKTQPDIIEMKYEELPGGHWLKLTPKQPLEFGEYALIEVVSQKEVNLNVWDFGVHPTAPENVEAHRPEVKRAPSLGRRPQ